MANSIENANRAAGERVPAPSIADGNNAVIDLISPTNSPKEGRRVLKDTTNTAQGSGSTNSDVIVSKLDPPGKRGARKPARNTGNLSRLDSKLVKGTRRKQRGQRTAASTGHAPAENNDRCIRETRHDSSVFSPLAAIADPPWTRTNSRNIEERCELKHQEKMIAAKMGRASLGGSIFSGLVPITDQSSTRTKRSKVQELLDRNCEIMLREKMDAANTERAPAEKTSSHANEAPDSNRTLSGQVSNRARELVEREREPRAAANTGNAPVEKNSHRIFESTLFPDDDSVSSDQAVRGGFAAELRRDMLSQANKYDERQKKMYESARREALEAFAIPALDHERGEVERQKSKIERMEMEEERLISEIKLLKTQVDRLTSENKALKTSFDTLVQNFKCNQNSSQLEP